MVGYNSFDFNNSAFLKAIEQFQRTIDATKAPMDGITAAVQAYHDAVAPMTAALQNINNLYAPILEQTRKYEELYNNSMIAALQNSAFAMKAIAGLDLSAIQSIVDALPKYDYLSDSILKHIDFDAVAEMYDEGTITDEDIAEEFQEIVKKKEFSFIETWDNVKKSKWFLAIRLLLIVLMFFGSPVVDKVKENTLEVLGVNDYWEESGVYEWLDNLFGIENGTVTEKEAKETVDDTKIGNISKQKREDLLAKIKEIRTFISAAPQDENTCNLLSYLSDLEKDVNGKKYGLIFEEHREDIDEVLNTHTPVLTEEADYFINNGGQMNYLIEGDNLSSLKLLEKTHKSKIDLIYIDPPYNTGHNDFTYDDTFVDSEDLFKHSKWISFMSERLSIAKNLLANDGAIFIQIDDNEQAPLKLLCDDIFGSDNFMGIIIQNKMNAKNDTVNIQKNHEYILAYRKKTLYINGSRVKPTLLQLKEKYRSAVKDGDRYYYIGDSITTRGEGGTLNARPNLGYTIYYNPNNDHKIAVADYDLDLARTSNSIDEIYTHDKTLIEKGYVPILPPKVRGKLGCWTWALDKFNNETDNIIITGKHPNYSVKKRTFVSVENIVEQDGQLFYVSIEQSNSRSIVDYSTNDGTNVLSEIMGTRATFSNPKNLELLKYLISLKQGKDNIVLDFFAGSGTTGHAVLKLNEEDKGSRRFILCTNNDNNICREVTYERIKKVIAKEGYTASLKYYKVEYIPISERMYYEYADGLLAHIRELVELENGVNFVGNAEIGIVLTEEELANFIAKVDDFGKCRKLYMGHDLLPSEEQEKVLKRHGITVNIIPDYYYRDLQEG